MGWLYLEIQSQVLDVCFNVSEIKTLVSSFYDVESNFFGNKIHHNTKSLFDPVWGRDNCKLVWSQSSVIRSLFSKLIFNVWLVKSSINYSWIWISYVSIITKVYMTYWGTSRDKISSKCSKLDLVQRFKVLTVNLWVVKMYCTVLVGLTDFPGWKTRSTRCDQNFTSKKRVFVLWEAEI